jgi:hypothetical protein
MTTPKQLLETQQMLDGLVDAWDSSQQFMWHGDSEMMQSCE